MRVTTLFLAAGARPNFMKLAPVYRALAGRARFSVSVVHTGQHYDADLSDVFFEDLGLPRPDIMLRVRAGRHGAQTARTLERFERALLERTPDAVIVFGDVNSTVACALAVAKAAYPSGRRPRLAHVEAGLRSFDRTMPEEINRVVTDALSDFLFTTEESANVNLAREGVAPERVFFVGNVMIDTLLAHARQAAALRAWEKLALPDRAYALATLHRPSNVDDPRVLTGLMTALGAVGRRLPVVFPAHPRTVARLRTFGLDLEDLERQGIRLTRPLGYLNFLSLLGHARLVLTDSGGIQEETTILGIPCLTLRDSTERPGTVMHGTNTLVGTDPEAIIRVAGRTLEEPVTRPPAPPLWDGRASERIAEILERSL